MEAIVELKQRMLFLERAHASARMGHFVLDPKRQTIEFSSWVRDNIGLNDMPIPIDRLPEIVPEPERLQFAQKVKSIIEAEADFEFETNVVTAKGAIRTQRVTGIPAFEDQYKKENLIAYYGILQEITKENNARQELLEARDAVQAQLDARNNILAIVSHEIRTPLGGVLGIIDQLKREGSAAEREKGLELIEDSCEALLETLDTILQRSRVDQDSRNLASKRFSPRALAERVAELFRPLARRKALKIEVECDTDIEAIGDPVKIQQVLANFVSNAVKFTQSGVVSISVVKAGEDQSNWEFMVRDTGAGIDPKRLDRIFEPFGKSGADSLGKSVGAGLGLSITRDLVEAMNGTITVESEIGIGSVFKVALPLAPIEESEHENQLLGEQGQAIIMVERASDAVQAEAVFSQYGYEISTLEDLLKAQPKRENDVAVIADASKLDELPKGLIADCNQLIGLANEDELAGLAEVHGSKVSLIAKNNVARSLKELLDSNS